MQFSIERNCKRGGAGNMSGVVVTVLRRRAAGNAVSASTQRGDYSTAKQVRALMKRLYRITENSFVVFR